MNRPSLLILTLQILLLLSFDVNSIAHSPTVDQLSSTAVVFDYGQDYLPLVFVSSALRNISIKRIRVKYFSIFIVVNSFFLVVVLLSNHSIQTTIFFYFILFLLTQLLLPFLLFPSFLSILSPLILFNFCYWWNQSKPIPQPQISPYLTLISGSHCLSLGSVVYESPHLYWQ